MTTFEKFTDLDLTKTYRYSDYLLFQFKERVEIIRGHILKMSPAPSRAHQTVSNNLTGCFYENLKRNPCSVFTAPFDVRLPLKSEKKDSTVVQPDLCIICDEKKLDKQGCNGAPDLIVEIISPNNTKHDLNTKFNLYQEAGVQEYWIVEPLEKMLIIYTLKNEQYIGLRPQTEDENIMSPLFPELQIALEDVFYKV